MPSQLTATYWRRLNTGMRTLGVHLLDASQQGLSPDYTIADAAKGLRAGQAAAEDTLSWRYFHIQHQGKELVSSPDERPANSRRQSSQKMVPVSKATSQAENLLCNGAHIAAWSYPCRAELLDFIVPTCRHLRGKPWST